MTNQEVAVARVLKAIETIREGRMVIMVDDEDRENEGDLVFAATHVTPAMINFMTKEARGLICLSLPQADVDRLALPMMMDATKHPSPKSTAFTVSIEAKCGVTTGISAADRAHTVKVAVDETSGPEDIVVPGHIFPLKARPGGVLERAGHTEGSVDLARLAGLKPAAVICEVMNDDGSMARMPDLEIFSKKHGIPIVTIADLVTFRLFKESLIEEVAVSTVQYKDHLFESYLFRSRVDGLQHFALVHNPKKQLLEEAVVDVRVHRQRGLLDVFGANLGTAQHRIEYGLQMLAASKAGVFVYLTHADPQAWMPQEFSELVASEETQAEQRKSSALNNWAATDSRMLGIGAQILRYLGVQKMRVHMSNPQPLKGLVGYDLDVVETIPIFSENSMTSVNPGDYCHA